MINRNFILNVKNVNVASDKSGEIEDFNGKFIHLQKMILIKKEILRKQLVIC